MRVAVKFYVLACETLYRIESSQMKTLFLFCASARSTKITRQSASLTIYSPRPPVAAGSQAVFPASVNLSHSAHRMSREILFYYSRSEIGCRWRSCIKKRRSRYECPVPGTMVSAAS